MSTATVPSPLTVTLVSAVRLRPGREAEHRRLHDEAVLAATGLGGLVRAELVAAIAGVQDETVALLTFTDRAALDRWLAADVRRDALDAMAALCENTHRVTVLGDFAGWFPADPAAPRRWKQALVVLAGLVPVAALLSGLRQHYLPELPLLVSTALVSTLNVAALTWIVMPALTRLCRPWLTR